jgi:hypothetical protein
MTRLTIGSAMLAKLQGLSETVALCDEQGRIVGHFVPSAALELDIPEEELDHRAANFRGRPLGDLTGTRAWLLDVAAEAQRDPTPLPADLAANHDHYAHGKPRE